MDCDSYLVGRCRAPRRHVLAAPDHLQPPPRAKARRRPATADARGPAPCVAQHIEAVMGPGIARSKVDEAQICASSHRRRPAIDRDRCSRLIDFRVHGHHGLPPAQRRHRGQHRLFQPSRQRLLRQSPCRVLPAAQRSRCVRAEHAGRARGRSYRQSIRRRPCRDQGLLPARSARRGNGVTRLGLEPRHSRNDPPGNKTASKRRVEMTIYLPNRQKLSYILEADCAVAILCSLDGDISWNLLPKEYANWNERRGAAAIRSALASSCRITPIRGDRLPTV